MYVRTRLGRWFYEESGRRREAGEPAIVLLHGLLFDGGMWRGQVGPLSTLGRVLAFDAPGHGKSEDPPPFTMEEHARAVIDAMDSLDVERAVVVGLSWGGMLAMRLALSRPERLAAMVLLDTSADGSSARERLEYRLLTAVSRRIGLPPALLRAKVAPLMFGPETFRRNPALVDEFVRGVSGFSREGTALATHAVSIERSSIVDALPTITVPTLVGYGEHDAATPGDHSRRIAARIPRATLVVFPKAGHISALESPADVNAAIVPFVREHMAVKAPAGSPPAPAARREGAGSP